MQRRRVLCAFGTSVSAGIAGCSSTLGNGDSENSNDDNSGSLSGNGTSDDVTKPQLVIPELEPSEYSGDTLNVNWVAGSALNRFRETDHIPNRYVGASRIYEWNEDSYAISGLNGSFTLFANSPGWSAMGEAENKREPDQTYEGFEIYEGSPSWIAVRDTTVIKHVPTEKLMLEPSTAIERIIDAWEGDGVELSAAQPDVAALLETVDPGEFLDVRISMSETFQETTGKSHPAGATAGLLGLDITDESTATVRVSAAYPSDPDEEEFENALTEESPATRQLPLRNPTTTREETTLTTTNSHDIIPATADDGKVNLVDSDYVLDVTASQYEFTFSHSDGSSETDEVTVPADQPIGFRFNSADVFHGFHLPEFEINVEVSPKQETRALIELPEKGNYQFECNEYCGPGHNEHLGEITLY